jgi:uncharacterized membrane protein
MRLLLLILFLAAAFVFATADSLPPIVASHFAAGGAANGFMPRGSYLRFFVALLIGVPLLIALLSGTASVLPARFVNLPNRDYWLAPERRAETLAYLRNQGNRFGIVVAVFLCFVHWLVVHANALSPPLFPEPLFFAGMAAFLLCLVIGLGGFVLHFSRRP